MNQEIIESIARHCPEVLMAYIHCYNRCDYNGTTVFPREMVEGDMSESWTKFRNAIKKLAREDLLEWNQLDETIYVTLGDLPERDSE